MPLVQMPQHVLMQRVQGECLLLNLESGKYFTLDTIGTRMLDLAMDETDAETCVRQLQQEYDAEAAHIRHDFRELLDNLRTKGLTR
ncbi:MAG: PqqD family protein [Chromatiales bacterium]|nr:PqqD family protein [Chromatiales bacterium]